MTSIDNPDYWALLGLSPESNAEELKSAFKREARRWHPDLNTNKKDAEERFKWINEAYLVLSDPKKRFEWERSGRPTIQIEMRPKQTQKMIPIQSRNALILFV